MRAHVFLGPSLPRAEAARILDAIYLPPIQQGDLLRLLEREPNHADLIVGIVDGYFETVPAIWHKEILSALSRGVRVFGAASMGALRAAELHGFGMIGVGTIFEWFRDGTIFADDEVAVQHGPEALGYLALSHALVDIRHGCARALAGGVIDADLAGRIIAAARALPYAERTHDAIAAALGSTQPNALDSIGAWNDFVARDWTSLKAIDASALLTAIHACLERPHPAQRVDFVLEETVFLDRLRNDIALDAALTACGIVNRDEAVDLESLRATLLLKIVAREAGLAAGWVVTSDELTEDVGRVCRRLGLTDVEMLRERLTAAGLGEAAFWAHLRDERFVRRLMRRHISDIDRQVADHIRLRDALDL